MTSKQIYDWLQNGEIEKAKQALLEDICVKQSKNHNTTKAIQRLSKIIRKNALKERPRLAGAIYNGTDTFMCDGYILLVLYNEHTQGLTYADDNPQVDFRYNDVICRNCNGLEEVVIDKKRLAEALANKEEQLLIGDGLLYNPKFLKYTLDCFENPKIYKLWNGIIQIEEDNKKAIVMGMRIKGY